MKDLPLEKLVTEKSKKKQIAGFLESLGRWKNKQKRYTFYFNCIREAINEDGFLDKLAEYLDIDSEEFQKAIDETESIIKADKKRLILDTIKREKLKLNGLEKNFEPFVDWVFKRRTGVSGKGSAYEIRNLKERTFAELNLKVRSILSKSENNVNDEVLKDIGKEIEKHYLKISNNLLIEILRYTLFTTSQSTATLQDNPGKYKFDCDGKQIMKNENA